MKNTVIFFIVIYVASLAGGGYLYLKNTASNKALSQELSTIQTKLIDEQLARIELQKKISDARGNTTFLFLSLCPTLQTADKEALCMKDNTEWFSQTIQAGTMITDPDTKTKMGALLISLGAKTKPTAKQLYEMLKPIEVSSLSALSKNLQ